jgi:hypothetical protein
MFVARVIMMAPEGQLCQLAMVLAALVFVDLVCAGLCHH